MRTGSRVDEDLRKAPGNVIARRVIVTHKDMIGKTIAGSMTDPPALAFSTKFTRSDYPSLAYANVYPLTMLLRILVAQIAVLMLC